MFKLIQNELYKLFHKKSTYIVLIIAFLFLILVNVIYNTTLIEMNETYYYETDLDSEIANLNQVIPMYEANQEKEELINAQANLATFLLLKETTTNWQRDRVNEYYASKIYDYYWAYYNDDSKLNVSNLAQEATEIKTKILAKEEKFFIQKDIAELKAENARLKTETFTNDTEKAENEINQEINNLKITLDEYYLANNIKDGSYLATAFNNTQMYAYNMVKYQHAKTKKEKAEYAEEAKIYYLNKYILDNKVDLENTHTLRNVIINLFSESELFILIFVIMIAGSIVSDEFNKGTVKSLLTIPYKRSQILTAKLIVCLLMIPLIAIFMLVSEFIIGGLFFGYSSLAIPLVSYNLSTASYLEVNVIAYYFLLFASKLPMVILLMTLAFALSVLLLNTAFAITVTFMGYIGSSIINGLALTYHLKWLNYFVTPNWDLSPLLFGGVSEFGISLSQSLIVCFIYLAIMLVISYIIFQKRNIKNI